MYMTHGETMPCSTETETILRMKTISGVAIGAGKVGALLGAIGASGISQIGSVFVGAAMWCNSGGINFYDWSNDFFDCF